MQKKNRFLMIVLSSLLCLTLISSCLTSGIYAKYVTKDSATVSSVIKKFGVKITTTVNSELAGMAGEQPIYSSDNTAKTSVTYEKITLAPGATYLDAVNFEITGTADVPVRVTITCNVGYYTGTSASSKNTVRIPQGYCGNTGSSVIAVPLGYTFGAKNASNGYVIDRYYVVEPWRFGRAANLVDDDMANSIKDKINFTNKVGTETSGESTNAFSTISKDFKAGEEIVFYPNNVTQTAANKINQFEFGFVWPFDEAQQEPLSWTRQEEYKKYNLDEVTMYYQSEDKADGIARFNFVYTVTIEQIQS